MIERMIITLVRGAVIACLGVFFVCCAEKKQEGMWVTRVQADSMIRAAVSAFADSLRQVEAETETPTEKRLREAGLVDIADVEPSVAVKLVYATPYNFVGKVLYKDLNRAFMLPESARRLADAQKRLKTIRPDLNLIVYDAARPLSVQQELWDMVKGTDKMIFVSNPAKGGGLHNYGAAVDVSLVDAAGCPLAMGSSYDFFGEEAKITDEAGLLRKQLITRRELDNRLLLRRVMTEAGFRPLHSEWWHFNLMSSDIAKETLTLIP